MPFHRLTVPSYLGGLPSGFDYINNALVGTPAPADGPKVGGTNAGTYFDAFGEDATSSNANRGNKALAENCDYLDNVVNTPTPVLDSAQFTLVAPQNYYALTGDIFVGKLGTSNNQTERDKLACVVTDSDGNEIIDSTGTRAMVSQIDDGGGVPANVVGTQASGFYTNPTVRFNISLPAGVYRVYYGRKSRLSDITNTTVDIGAIVANSVLTAPRTSWETMRFMAETSRRTAGSVDALVCTVLETPGAGDNIKTPLEYLTIDLDPTDLAPDSRYLTVRAGRDGTPYTLFEVVESMPGSNSVVWQSRTPDLSLCDERMRIAMGGGNGPMLLTSATHYKYKDWGVDTAEQPSLMEMFNRRWAVTCGDGVNTFGDFNGINALEDALTFATTNGVTKIRIFLKNGLYQASSFALSATNVDLTIEGESKGGVVIRIDGPYALSLSGSGARALFRNVSFLGNVGRQALAVLYTAPVMFEDCSFENAYIYLGYTGAADRTKCFGGNLFVLSRCTFLATVSDVLDTAFIHVLYSTSGASPYILSELALVEDCTFTREDLDSPIVYLHNNATSNGARNVRWSFQRCTMNLGSTGTTGGDMTGNCGVLELSLGTSSALSIELLEWVDCNVYANSYSTPGTNSILLFLKSTNAVGGQVYPNHFRISGGEWLCKATTQLSPFYIGLNTHTRAYGGVTHFLLEDVILGNTWTNFSNGAPHSSVGFTDGTSYWAAFVVGAQYAEVRNVRWAYQSGASDSGQIWLHAARTLHVDSMHSEGSGTGTGGSPRYRYRFGMCDVSHYRHGVVENASLTNILGVAAANGGMIWLDAPLSWSGVTVPSNAFLFRKCRVAHAVSVVTPAFYIEPALPAVASENGHVHYEECEVYNVGGHGWSWGAANTYAPLKDVVFSRCLFDTCNEGVHLSFSPGGACLLHDITFDHCTFRDCASYGVLLAVNNAWVEEEAGASFIANIFDNNNGGASAHQVFIYSSTPAPVGSAYGNRACKDGSGRGFFFMQNVPSDNFRGTETGYTYEETGVNAIREVTYLTTMGAAVANRRNHTSNANMLHNTMRWV